MKKKELKISIKDFRTIILIVTVPFILTFALEHFGEIKYFGFGGVTIDEYRASSVEYTSILGNEIKENLYQLNKEVGYVRQDNGNYVVEENYLGRLHYYFIGLKKDIFLPIILILIALGIFLFKKKYSVKMT